MKKNIIVVASITFLVLLFSYISVLIAVSLNANRIALATSIFVACLVVEGLILFFAFKDIITKNEKQLNYINKKINDIQNNTFRTSKDYNEHEILGQEMKEIVKNLTTLDMVMYNYSIEKYKLDFVLDNIKQGVISLDYDNRITICNKWLKKIWEQTDDILGKNIFQIISDKKFCEDAKKIIEEKKNAKFDYEYNGRILTLRFYYINNIGIEYLINIYDNTYERQNETLRNEFLFNASYELNKPIKNIEEVVEYLEKNKNLSQEEITENIKKINNYTNNIDAILKDTASLSRMDAKNDPDDLAEYDLDTIIDEVKDHYSEELKAKNITHKVEGDAKIFASKTYLLELIDNLYSNAVLYNRHNGKIDIKIIEDENKIQLSITDTGIGIDKKHQPRIFERFYVVDQTRSDNTGSTGLGLAIVKHICNNLNAKINFTSEKDVGTTFDIVFRKIA